MFVVSSTIVKKIIKKEDIGAVGRLLGWVMWILAFMSRGCESTEAAKELQDIHRRWQSEIIKDTTAKQLFLSFFFFLLPQMWKIPPVKRFSRHIECASRSRVLCRHTVYFPLNALLCIETSPQIMEL